MTHPEYLAVLAALGVESIFDIRTKRISLPAAAVFASCGIFFLIAEKRFHFPGTLTAFLPGITLFAVSALSGDGIGGGDALIVLILGLYFTFSELLAITAAAFLFSAVYAGYLFLRRKKDRRASFPFLPFLAASCLLFLLSGPLKIH